MNTFLNQINLLFAQLPDFLRKNKKKVWALFFLITTFALVGIPQFQLSSNQMQREMLKEGEAARKAMERFTYYFGSSNALVLPYQAKADGDIFSLQSLKTLKAIQDELLQESLGLDKNQNSPLTHIVRVRSLINVPYMEVDGENLFSKEFIGNQFPHTQEESDQLRALAFEHPEYAQSYLSVDGKYGAIVIKTDFRSVVNDEDEGFPDETEDVFEEFAETEDSLTEEQPPVNEEKVISLTKHSLKEYSDFEKRISEIINQPKYKKVLNFSPTSWGAAWEVDVLTPQLNMAIGGMLVVLVIILLFLFRSPSAIVWPLLLVLLPIGTMIGVAGWLSLSVKTTIYIAVSLTMVAGIADSVHIFSGYTLFRKKNYSHEKALYSVYKTSALGCFLTSITTALGMLSLVFIPIIDIRNLGILAALGVIAAMLFTLFILPAMLDLWSPYSKTVNTSPHSIQKLIRKIETVGFNNPKTVVSIFFIATVFFSYHAVNVKVDTYTLAQWSEEDPLRKAKELINDYFAGNSGIQVLLETGVEDGLKDPNILNAIESMTQKIEERYPSWVTKSYSIVNQVKYTFQNLNEGRSEMYKIPQNRGTLEETLFLFNNANPEDRRLLVTDDYSSASISIRLKEPGTQLGEHITNQMRADVDGIFAPLKENYPNLNITLTGSLVQKSAVKNYISWSQLKSFGLAFLVISLLFVVIFGSVQIGLISIIPNTLPIIAVFGVMGWLDIPLDQITLMVAPILIGIVVDDTIHFTMHFRYYMLEEKDMFKAIQHTFREAGQALIFTSIILAVAFTLLIGVDFVPVARFGLLSTIAIFGALLADFFLLPALIRLFNADFKVSEKAGEKAEQIQNRTISQSTKIA